jgi:hypothetical protein
MTAMMFHNILHSSAGAPPPTLIAQRAASRGPAHARGGGRISNLYQSARARFAQLHHPIRTGTHSPCVSLPSPSPPFWPLRLPCRSKSGCAVPTSASLMTRLHRNTRTLAVGRRCVRCPNMRSAVPSAHNVPISAARSLRTVSVNGLTSGEPGVFEQRCNRRGLR